MPNASAKLSIFLLTLYSSLILAIASIPAGCEIRGLRFLTEIKPTFQSLLHIPAFMVLTILFLFVIKTCSLAIWKAVFFTLGFALTFGLIIEGVQYLNPRAHRFVIRHHA